MATTISRSTWIGWPRSPVVVESHYKMAIDLQPTHPWWWSRWISYLATRGRFAEAKSNWRTAVDALSLGEDGSPDWIFLSLHRWVARWLLHWAELDFAEDVLRGIPRRLAENDTSIQTLWDLLRALRQARAVFRFFRCRFPPRTGGHRALTPTCRIPGRVSSSAPWVPARVEGVDQRALWPS